MVITSDTVTVQTTKAAMLPQISGYCLSEQVYENEQTVVYRATQLAHNIPVILKTLRQEYPSFNDVVKFRNQYTILKNVVVPGVVQPLSLEGWNNGYILVMRDAGGISLKEYCQERSLGVAQVLHIATQMAQILHELGQHHIVHKDIKPANILIDPENGQITLIDFSIASLLPKETQAIQHPTGLEGTLRYIAPEQTGRMNRGIDYRADFYALGVTLYELLTGIAPFSMDDPLELVHAHIAQAPIAPSTRNPKIPSVLSGLILKLMAKDAGDRYQSALGLKHDLEQCLNAWQADQTIPEFELGQRDGCDRFLIPEKLYGREITVKTLLAAFDRAAQGNTEMVVVAGFSGIGKTAVINEVHKPITQQQGYFIKGKFDQLNRDIPLSALVQALRSLVQQLLSESDTALGQWQQQIQAALGESAQVLIDVIPELTQILGPQPPVPELSGTAAQNRFNLLLSRFVSLFTTEQHPLVLFIDDLQWADAASLQFLERLMQETPGHLLLLGAYRDNEVKTGHPLLLTLQAIEQQGATNRRIARLALSRLSEDTVTQLIADTLRCSPAQVGQLAQWTYQKTQGNPFFTTQFLYGLYEDNHIAFDPKRGTWQCDMAKVQQLALTRNVIDLVITRLQKLPPETQDVLKLAACIGNRFDLGTLAIVCESPPNDVAEKLWAGLSEGFLLPEGETYKFFQGTQADTLPAAQTNGVQQPATADTVYYRFLHDRIQQAAYALIPAGEKEQIHYQIGQRLMAQSRPEELGEQIFELVGQLNYGMPFIRQQADRDELATLNLLACRKAKAATAYDAARNYASKGLALLGDQAWERQYEMTLGFYSLAADLAMLCGDYAAMEMAYRTITDQAAGLLEQVPVYCTKIQAHFAQGQLMEALVLALNLLAQLGHEIPAEPTPEDIQQSIGATQQSLAVTLAEKDIAELIDLPLMEDPIHIATMQVAMSIVGLTYLLGSMLFPIITGLAVRLSLKHGNTSSSALAYACYGVLACNLLHDVETGHEFGQLALELMEKLDARTIKPDVFCIVGFSISHRTRHLNQSLPLFKHGYREALELGSLEFAGYNASQDCLHMLWAAQPLSELQSVSQTYTEALLQLKQLGAADYCRIYWQVALNLRGTSDTPTELTGEALQETEFVPHLLAIQNLSGLFMFYVHKLMLAYLFGDIATAEAAAIECRKYTVSGSGTFTEGGFYFYDALTALAQMHGPNRTGQLSEDDQVLLDRVEANQATIAAWAQSAPMNHQHKLDLIIAEKARILGDHAAAKAAYDSAIAGAQAEQYIQEVALANELAAKFYLAASTGANLTAATSNASHLAAQHMQAAYYGYVRWEAGAKIAQLEATYPALLRDILQTPTHATTRQETLTASLHSIDKTSTNTQQNLLDLPAVMRAAQAISQEIELDKLLATLMQTVLATAGAESGHLILRQDQQWQVRAIADAIQTQALSIRLDDYAELPRGLIYAVARSSEFAVFANLSQDNRWSRDRYIIGKQPKSALCMPISRQGNVIGFLYLENNLVTNAFTNDQVEILQLLSSQAAISLENARLYQATEDYSRRLEAEVARKTKDLNQKAEDLEQTLKELQDTQAQLIHTEKMSSLGQLVAGVAHEINNPINFIHGNLKYAAHHVEDMMQLLQLYRTEYPKPTATIKEAHEDIDVDFIFDDANKLFKSMRMGSERIRNIVLSLRDFSRLDEAEVKQVDLHTGLESTLMVLRNQLEATPQHPEIRLTKSYGQLPKITCEARQLNQVFLNVLSNAIDAIHERTDATEAGEIRIQTDMTTDGELRITIANNGCVIPPDIHEQIFNPFFTTKPVGSGAGLGLSVSYSVIQKHGGTIRLKSSSDTNTIFEIVLPNNIEFV